MVLKIGKRIMAFRSGDITPVITCVSEKDLADLLRQARRVIVNWIYNRLETDKVEEASPLAELDGERYRRRTRSTGRPEALHVSALPAESVADTPTLMLSPSALVCAPGLTTVTLGFTVQVKLVLELAPLYA